MSLFYFFKKKMKAWNLAIIGYWVIGTGWYIEKALELSPSPPNLWKDSWKLLPFFISINWLNLITERVVVQKIYSKLHPVSCTNIHRDVTDFVNREMARNTKTWIFRERNIIFLKKKKFLTYASDDTFWEVTVL